MASTSKNRISGWFRRCVLSAVAAAAGGLTTHAGADTMLASDFECPVFNLGPVAGQQGWATDGIVQSAVVQPGLGGARSLRLNVPNSFVAANRLVNFPVAGQVITITADYLDTGNGAPQAGLTVFGENGQISGFANSGINYSSTNSTIFSPSVPVPDGVWNRVVLTLNFVNNTISGHVNGVLFPVLPINTTSTTVTLIQLYSFPSPSPREVYFDNISVTTNRPTNDQCAFPTAISAGTTVYNNTMASTDGPATIGCGTTIDNNGLGKDLWYLYSPTESGRVTLSTCGASWDTALAVYSGNCGSLTQIACNDDNVIACSSSAGTSHLTFTASAGQSYRIRAGGFAGNTGTAALTLSQTTTGACCNRWTASCSITTPAACSALGLRFDGFASTCSPSSCRACPADFNGSGGPPSVQDIFDFLAAYFAGC